MSIVMDNGKVDEKWLDGVLRENRELAIKKERLTDEFGAVCIKFVDIILCDGKRGFCKMDKLMKAEVCSRVYLHLCDCIDTYKPTKTEKPSNWVITVAKNAVIRAVHSICQDDCTSDAVAMVVGNEMLNKIDGIERNAPVNRILSERISILGDFRLNARAKEQIFGQAWRDSWYRRDHKTLVRRARQHNKLHAMGLAKQMRLGEEIQEGLKQLLKDHEDGRD